MRTLIAVVTALLITGCAAADEREQPKAPPPTSDTSTPGQLTVSGTVAAGVESGCLILRAQGSDYLLVGGKGLKAGARVRVRGHIDKDVMSFCQQGTPFVVAEVLEP